MNHSTYKPALGATAITLLISLSVALVCCGGPSQPGASARHNTVPPQSVNDDSLGVIRVRFQGNSAAVQDNQRRALDAWMTKRGLGCPKLAYLLDQLGRAGFDTAIAIIPGDTSILDDAGIYVGGPAAKSSEDLEDVLIKVGGFSLGGLAASKLQVVPVGNGWYFVGINGDGVIEGASNNAAERMSDMLEHVGDGPACAAVPIEGLDASIDELAPQDQSRMIRRLRNVAQALDDAIALAVTVSPSGRTEILIAFPDQESAAALDKAFARIRKDMELALQGSIEQNEVTPAEAERDRQIIAALRTQQRGDAVVLYEETAAGTPPGS